MLRAILVCLLFHLGLTYAHYAHIQNHCPFDVYVTSVAAKQVGRDIPVTNAVIPSGGDWSEPYQMYPIGQGGQSLKIRLSECLDCEDGPAPITQFEYTVDHRLWYDISNVNCLGEQCPISRHGIYLSTDQPGCDVAYCGPDETECVGAYLFDKDDTKARACYTPTAVITLDLCTEYMAGPPKAPPIDSSTDKAKECTGWHLVEDFDSCCDIADHYGIELSTFYAWNPSVHCEDLAIGSSVCIRR